MLHKENVGASKPVHKSATGFYRARSFREVEILVERVRFATVLLGGLAGALFIWFRPDPILPDSVVETRAETCTPFPAKQALPRIAQSAGADPALRGSRSSAPESEVAPDPTQDCVDLTYFHQPASPSLTRHTH